MASCGEGDDEQAPGTDGSLHEELWYIDEDEACDGGSDFPRGLPGGELAALATILDNGAALLASSRAGLLPLVRTAPYTHRFSGFPNYGRSPMPPIFALLLLSATSTVSATSTDRLSKTIWDLQAEVEEPLLVCVSGADAEKALKRIARSSPSLEMVVVPVATIGDVEAEMSIALKREGLPCALRVAITGSTTSLSRYGDCRPAQERLAQQAETSVPPEPSALQEQPDETEAEAAVRDGLLPDRPTPIASSTATDHAHAPDEEGSTVSNPSTGIIADDSPDPATDEAGPGSAFSSEAEFAAALKAYEQRSWDFYYHSQGPTTMTTAGTTTGTTVTSQVPGYSRTMVRQDWRLVTAPAFAEAIGDQRMLDKLTTTRRRRRIIGGGLMASGVTMVAIGINTRNIDAGGAGIVLGLAGMIPPLWNLLEQQSPSGFYSHSQLKRHVKEHNADLREELGLTLEDLERVPPKQPSVESSSDDEEGWQ